MSKTSHTDVNSIKSAMTFPLHLAQFFGLFPPPPVTKNGKFSLHWRTVYSLTTFVLFLLEFFALIRQQVRIDPSKRNVFMFNAVVFHIGGLIQFVLIFKISMEWSYLMEKWDKIEKSMANYDTDKNLSKKLKLITICLIILAAGIVKLHSGSPYNYFYNILVEHFLVNAYKLKTSFQVELTSQRAFRNYFKYASYSHIFEIIDYSFVIGLVAQFVNLQRTFNWNFVDVFVMLFGSALSFRLKLIRKRLEFLVKLKIVDVNVWNKIRDDYINVVKLVEEVNDRISYIIFASFSLNLYLTLFQLFSSFKHFNNDIEKIYFCISFGLLLARLVFVCYFGGEVFEEWRNIRFSLSSVKTSAYNQEVDRFICHIKTCEVILSGKKLFYITRNLILKVINNFSHDLLDQRSYVYPEIAAVVVTYELVMIQFNLGEIINGNE